MLALSNSLSPLLQHFPVLEGHLARPALLPRPTEAAYFPRTSPYFPKCSWLWIGPFIQTRVFLPKCLQLTLQAQLILLSLIAMFPFSGSIQVLNFPYCMTRNILVHTITPFPTYRFHWDCTVQTTRENLRRATKSTVHAAVLDPGSQQNCLWNNLS